MAWCGQCDCWSWYARYSTSCDGRELRAATGPAHALYFATYEAVKQAMGGNEGKAHHPLAAGGCSPILPAWLLLLQAKVLLATSGACATIASDAVMNPFDGKLRSDLHLGNWLT